MTASAIRPPIVERSTRASRIALGLGLVVVVVLASMPYWAERSDLRLVTEFLYLLAIAQMWNLLAGYGGMVSIGQQAFIGIGGYALFALAMHGDVNPFVAVPLAGLVAALIAAPTAWLVFRLRGAHFAVGTWVLAEVFRLIVANIPAVGGGSGASLINAVRGIPMWTREATTFWLALALGVGSIVLVYAILRSRIGLALTAVRDSEPAAQSLGVRVQRLKLIVYIASALGCGMIGALIYITKLRISPDAAFSVEWTATAIFIVVIGGIGRIEGPIVGTLVYFALRNYLGDFGAWYMIALGGVAIVVMVKAPQGLWGLIADRFDLHLFPVQRRVK